jgi:ABC-2 type transport system permease protein
VRSGLLQARQQGVRFAALAMPAVRSIFRQQLRFLLGDPGPLVVYLLAPLLMMAILKPAEEVVLAQQGFREANGAEQVVPGMTAMFSFFWARSIGALFFSEHKWGTWERLQVSFANPVQVLLGKMLPIVILIGLQHLLLFGLGTLLFDLNANGEVLGLVPLFIALNLCVVMLGLALVAICRTSIQIDVISNLLTILFATLGGALVPSFSLPALGEDLAPATPTYCAVDGSRAVILEGEGISAVLGPTAVLLGFAALFAVIAATRFRFSDVKVAA